MLFKKTLDESGRDTNINGCITNKVGQIKAVSFTTDQLNLGCKIMIQKFTQHIVPERIIRTLKNKI